MSRKCGRLFDVTGGRRFSRRGPFWRCTCPLVYARGEGGESGSPFPAPVGVSRVGEERRQRTSGGKGSGHVPVQGCLAKRDYAADSAEAHSVSPVTRAVLPLSRVHSTKESERVCLQTFQVQLSVSLIGTGTLSSEPTIVLRPLRAYLQ